MPSAISILGSTGSIGLNTLQIVRTHPGCFKVKALAARRNADLLARQAMEFRPEMVCLFEKEQVPDLEKKLSRYRIKVVTGLEGLIEASRLKSADKVVFALVGAIGLQPIFAALQAGKDLAIANKEPLVVAGELLVAQAEKMGVKILPIDSEHSGLWQCLEGRRQNEIKKLVLTSSGGPFHGKKGSLARITPAQALKHPRWKMGAKITIDSATMMNKGLEVIEAAHLFKVAPEKIEVLVHPEAVIHAMVEFIDGTHLANIGITDMRIPIQFALSYPGRLASPLPALDLTEIHRLHFKKPDLRRFRCLALGYEAVKRGGTYPAVLNAANEIAVEAFLRRKIAFQDIARVIEKSMQCHSSKTSPALSDLLNADAWAREHAKGLVS